MLRNALERKGPRLPCVKMLEKIFNYLETRRIRREFSFRSDTHRQPDAGTPDIFSHFTSHHGCIFSRFVAESCQLPRHSSRWSKLKT